MGKRRASKRCVVCTRPLHDDTVARNGGSYCADHAPHRAPATSPVRSESAGRVADEDPMSDADIEAREQALLADYLRATWSHMILSGRIDADDTFDRHDLYFGGPTDMPRDKKDADRQLAALQRIKREGIDFERTEDPATEHYSVFGGTFGDDEDHPYLQGEVVTNAGTRYTITSSPMNNENVTQIVRDIVRAPTIEDALDQRIDALRHQRENDIL